MPHGGKHACPSPRGHTHSLGQRSKLYLPHLLLGSSGGDAELITLHRCPSVDHSTKGTPVSELCRQNHVAQDKGGGRGLDMKDWGGAYRGRTGTGFWGGDRREGDMSSFSAPFPPWVCAPPGGPALLGIKSWRCPSS